MCGKKFIWDLHVFFCEKSFVLQLVVHFGKTRVASLSNDYPVEKKDFFRSWSKLEKSGGILYGILHVFAGAVSVVLQLVVHFRQLVFHFLET